MATSAGAGKPEKKRLLFITVPMKGHLVHTARLAEWFLQFPDDYEIHVASHPFVFPFMPEGVITHAMKDAEGFPPLNEYFADVMADAMHLGEDWYHSHALMMAKSQWQVMLNWMLFALDVLEEVLPDCVIADHSYSAGNVLYTLATRKQIPMVCITSMGRPESVTKVYNAARIGGEHPEIALKLIPDGFQITKALQQRVGGMMIPMWKKPITIYPGAQVLVEDPPLPHELYTGPFLPLPGLLDADADKKKLARSATFSMRLKDAPELESFLNDNADGLPIVYLALGTLVRPTPELMGRLIEALDGGPWKIVWALPQQFQSKLPQKLGKQWLMMSFVPQFDLLRSGKVKAFLSHCGGNSTVEALCQGVPMIGMPFLGDQYEWAESVVRLKLGLQVDKLKTSPQEIRKAVQTVVDTPMYKENAVSIAKQMLDDARLRLDVLRENWKGKEVKKDKNMKVGVPVAAGIIDAAAHGLDPRSRLPPNLAPATGGLCSRVLATFGLGEEGAEALRPRWLWLGLSAVLAGQLVLGLRQVASRRALREQ